MISVGLRLQLGLGTGLIGRLGGMLLKAQMIHMWELWIHVNTIEKKTQRLRAGPNSCKTEKQSDGG